MTRNKLVLLALLAGTMGACGGRTTLRVIISDGGGEADVAVDGKHDLSGVDLLSESGAAVDVSWPDLFPADVADAATPDVAQDGVRRDLSPADGARNDGRRLDGARNDGSTDGRRDGASIDAQRDGGASDMAATLVRIGVTPPNPVLAVGVPFSALLVTAVYSDGSSVNVTGQSTFTSGDSTIVQVSGSTLTGLKAGSTTVRASYSGQTATVNVTVSSSPLQSITIDGVTTVSSGQYILVTATGIYANGSKQDLTAQAAWASSNTASATVSRDSATGKERITGVAAGTASVTATYQGVTGKASITVTAAAMTAITVTPVQPIMQRGVARSFQATATFAEGSTADVTLQATWSSSNTTVASVASGASGVVVRALAAGSATISARVGSITGSTTVRVTTPTLLSIAVMPATWSPNVGGSEAFTATGTYSDRSTGDVTLSATWSSSNDDVVAVSNAAGQQGKATALAAGSAQIQAALEGVSGSAEVTVSSSPLASIAITPNPVLLVLGLKLQLVATGTYQNGTKQVITDQVAWTTDAGEVAGVANAAGTAGQITGLGVGSTTVHAALSGISGEAPVTVAEAKLISIAVSPATASVSAGKTQQFTATGSYDNGATPDLTTQVTWSSSNIGVAQVSNAAGSQGLATSLTAGNATILATLDGITGTAALAVTAPGLSSIMIAPAVASIQIGGTQAFTVTGVYQNGTTAPVAGTWSSSDMGVATIAAVAGGRRATATGVTAGASTIGVTYQGMSDSALLTVTPVATLVGLSITPANPPMILVGGTQQFQAYAIYSNGSTTTVTGSASWTSSNAAVASVSSGGGPGGAGRGLATGVGAGTATITATYRGQSASVDLSVRNPTPTGLVVAPPWASIRVNGTQQFVALLLLDDGTTQTVTNAASWTTSNGSIASITSGGGRPAGTGRGLATGLAAGTVTVTATYSGFSDTASLTVTAATPTDLVVTPASPTLQVGQMRDFVATLVYDDGTTANVTPAATWSSSDPTVATITTAGGPGPGGGGGGVAIALATGLATITAKYGGLSGTASLTVTDPALVSVQVTPANPGIPVGATQQFVATAVFADFSTRNVTGQATWKSSNTSVAVVVNAGGAIGRASALAEGTATITATYQTMSGTSQLSVAGSVQSISVTPANPTTVLGLPVAFTATAILSNSATFPVTGLASWTSSDPTVATVNAGGVAVPVMAGSTTITAAYLGKSGSSSLAVSSATLSSIALTPNPVSLAVAASQQLMASGTYSDASSHDLTFVATWFSSDSSAAVVSNAAGSRGLLTALKAGSTDVTAVFAGVTSASDTVTVTP